MKISGWIRDGSFEVVIDFRGTSSPVSPSMGSSDTLSDGDRGVEMPEERVEKDPPVPKVPEPTSQKGVDVRNEILQAVQELQAAKRSVSVYSVSKHLGWGHVSSSDKKGLLIRGVLDDLGMPKSKRGRPPKTPAPADKNVRILLVKGGNLICPKDNSDHIMEVCNVSDQEGNPCPSFIKREIDSNGNGSLFCSLPLEQEVS